MKGKTLRNVIIVLVIIIVVVLLYGLFFSGGVEYRSGFGDVFSSFDVEEGTNTSIGAPNEAVLTILRSVENINLGNNVFSNQSFVSLIDKSIELPDAGAVGRENIFAPVTPELDITQGETVILDFTPPEITPEENEEGTGSIENQ